jgi:hypothetical protein
VGEREGPLVTIRRSCFDCAHVRSSYYAVQGDSGCDVSCAKVGRGIGDSTWTTPEWCPFLTSAAPAARGDETAPAGPVVVSGQMNDTPETRELVAAAAGMLASSPPPSGGASDADGRSWWACKPGRYEARCDCPAHPNAPMRRFGALARCSECGEALTLCGASIGTKECVREKGHPPDWHTSPSGSSWSAAPAPRSESAPPPAPALSETPAEADSTCRACDGSGQSGLMSACSFCGGLGRAPAAPSGAGDAGCAGEDHDATQIHDCPTKETR